MRLIAATSTTEAKDSPTGAWRDLVRARALARKGIWLPHESRTSRVVAIAAAVLLHALAALYLYFLMRPVLTEDRGRIEVRLLDAAPSEPALPEPPPMSSRILRAEPEKPASAPFAAQPGMPSDKSTLRSAEPEQTATIDAAKFFNPDGSVAIPREQTKTSSMPAQASAYVAPVIAPSPLLETRRPIKLRPNHFAGAWRAPANENLLGAALRKTAEVVDEKLTVRKEFTTPWGSKVKCQASYMMVMALAGCGWGFAPKPYEPEERWKPATVLDEK